MKSCAMASFVFFIVAITMITIAEGAIKVGVCKKWAEPILECGNGNDPEACCKNHEIPKSCRGFCLRKCGKWVDEMVECRKGNEAKECCEKQGVSSECSAYCETA